MSRGTAHRRAGRINVVALAATLTCLLLVGWAVRGLLQDEVPAPSGFGSITATSTTAEGDGDGGIADLLPAPPSVVPGPARSSAAVPPVEERVRPVRLMVPSLGLDVPLDEVSIRPDGQMAVPDDVRRAGWYRHGPAPGAASGSVVVAGHVDGVTGPGAFLQLTQVTDGAEVVVELDDGTMTEYRVAGGEAVAKAHLPVDEIFRRDGEPVLRLVTCTGQWSPRAGHYTDNLVITAVPVT